MIKNYCSELIYKIDNIINSLTIQKEKQDLNKLRCYITTLIYFNDGINTQNVCKNLLKIIN